MAAESRIVLRNALSKGSDRAVSLGGQQRVQSCLVSATGRAGPR